MQQDTLLQFISTQGLGWFFAIVMLVPLSFVLLMIIGKRYLGLDFQAFLDNQRREIEAETQVVTELRQLNERQNQMSDAMWGNRDYTDRKLREVTEYFDAQHKEILCGVRAIQHDATVILSIAKKRKTDWIREPNTEVFLKERPS